MITAPALTTKTQPPIDTYQQLTPSQASTPQHEVSALAHDNTPASGDLALSRAYGAVLATTRGSIDDRNLSVSPIASSSTFGQWWAQLGRAFQAPDVVRWMSDRGIDPATVNINPGSGKITFSLKHDLKAPREVKSAGQDDAQWAAVSGPLLAAGRVIASDLKFSTFKPPQSASSNSAPLWLVGTFYKEQNANPVLLDHARAAELAAGKGFAVVNDPTFSHVRERRNEDELAGQKAVLGNIHTFHNVALSLENLLNPSEVSTQSIVTYLTNTQVQTHPDSTYSTTQGAAQTMNLKEFIENHGWEVPRDQAQVENLVNALRRPAFQSPEHGNLGGALSWPTPLDKASVDQLHADLRDGKFGDIDGSPFKSVVEYLLNHVSVSSSEWQNPRELINSLINSPKGLALGKAIQAKFDARSIKGTANDWLLAAMSINARTPDKDGRQTIAGLVFPDVQDFGSRPVDFALVLANHLLDTDQATTFEKAQVLAYVLFSSQAPELLVKDLPKGVTFGTHSWVSFVTAVGRIEATAPGATANMTYAQVMLEADITPISAQEQQIEYSVQERALAGWAVANGKGYPSSDTQKHTVRREFDERVKELRHASETLGTPVPSAKALALNELKIALPHLSPDLLEKRCIVLDPPVSGLHAHYSILDLYRDGRYIFETPDAPGVQYDRAPTPTRWVSKSDDIDMDDVIFKLQELSAPEETFSTRFNTLFNDYADHLTTSIETQFKHMVSLQPEEDRKNLEYGKYTIVQEMKLTYKTGGHRHFAPTQTPVSQDNSVLIKTVLEGRTRTYEFNFTKNTVTERNEYGNFEPGNVPSDSGRPRIKLQEIEDSRVVQGYSDERKGPRPTPDSYESGRIRTIAKTLSRHANIEGLRAEANGATNIDSSQAYIDRVHNILLNLIPGRSAVKNFIDGNIGEGFEDLAFDAFGFLVGVGVAAKGAKVVHGLSTLAKFGRVSRIIASSAVNTLNPLGGIDDLARGAFNVVRKGVPKAYSKLSGVLRNVDITALLKKPNIAQGTLKGARSGENVIAKFDDATGHWHELNVKTRKMFQKPLPGFQPNDVSVENLTANVEALTASYKAQGRSTHICFENSIMVAQAHNTLPLKTRTALLENLKGQPSNYTPRYKEIMGVTPVTTQQVFDPSKIKESGFINFTSNNEAGKMVHTAYIHKAADNQLYIFNANQTELATDVLSAAGDFKQIGSAAVINLNNNGLQKFLNRGYEYVFTPNSTINANVQRLAA
ncbi:hypothetical protein ACLBW8_05120 [Pseudomonas sp. M5A4_2d]